VSGAASSAGRITVVLMGVSFGHFSVCPSGRVGGRIAMGS